ncbi:hypothetical protein B296_00012468 [Ensete ventricosum]|uniref:Uncharacterized protein n=1 Tax=Ensete ventricosum TaxID=4639 RepID=A0A426ZDT9_ENSVE|nr:hypothetical protein B296_00012468 [Ensete ventricosum]
MGGEAKALHFVDTNVEQHNVNTYAAPLIDANAEQCWRRNKRVYRSKSSIGGSSDCLVEVVVGGLLGKVGTVDEASYMGGEPSVNAIQVENVATTREEVEFRVVLKLSEAHPTLELPLPTFSLLTSWYTSIGNVSKT